MRFYVEQAPKGSWRVMLQGSHAPVSEHDTEEEARERLSSYLRGVTSGAGAREAAPDPRAGPRPGD